MARSRAHRLVGASLVFTALIFTACTTLEPGQQVHYLVGCGGAGTGLPNICYAKAEKLCPGGYTVLSGDPPDSNDPQTMRIACRPQSAKP